MPYTWWHIFLLKVFTSVITEILFVCEDKVNDTANKNHSDNLSTGLVCITFWKRKKHCMIFGFNLFVLFRCQIVPMYIIISTNRQKGNCSTMLVLLTLCCFLILFKNSFIHTLCRHSWNCKNYTRYKIHQYRNSKTNQSLIQGTILMTQNNITKVCFRYTTLAQENKKKSNTFICTCESGCCEPRGTDM